MNETLSIERMRREEINNKEIEAIIKIQRLIASYFYKKYGIKWRKEIIQRRITSDYDYYCYRYNIIDSWHDYVERLEYQYGRDN